jgi:hypothetical protein
MSKASEQMIKAAREIDDAHVRHCDAITLRSMATSFRSCGEFAFNPDDMADVLDKAANAIDPMAGYSDDTEHAIDALRPFAKALKAARGNKGSCPDFDDVLSEACRLISYDDFKEALTVVARFDTRDDVA